MLTRVIIKITCQSEKHENFNNKDKAASDNSHVMVIVHHFNYYPDNQTQAYENL